MQTEQVPEKKPRKRTTSARKPKKEQSTTPTPIAAQPSARPTGAHSRLMAFSRGQDVEANVEIPRVGSVQQLWRPYIGAGKEFNGKGFIGADVAIFLCAYGFCDVSAYGRNYPARTDPNTLPDAQTLSDARATYRFIGEIPTRQEFVQLVNDVRNSDLM